MDSRDDGWIRQWSGVRTSASRIVVVVISLVLVASAAGGVATGAGEDTGTPAVENAEPNERWTAPPGTLSQVQDGGQVSEEKRDAAEEAVGEAVTALQRQGVSVNQSQRAAAVNGSLAAVAQYQNATVEQVQNASAGAVEGALLQSQNVSVAQVQNATYGGASGALSQHGNASATQLQHAAYGGTHGAVAQRQNATVEQVQVVAQGAASGAAHEAGKQADNGTKVHPGAVREAAQGAAFGALTQTQNVSVEQRQYAAAGAAEGALSQNQSVSVTQKQFASIKQIQVAAMGAAEGALTVSQRQEVEVTQVQAAARGACKGALKQVQEVSVTQIQEASLGAAKGAISQSQQASVTQIQAAATGGAQGVLVQRQTVSITQIQYAAAGAASGAAKSAAQNQVVNVRQIQAAATGAGQGSVVQVQQVDVVQIQVIAESGASGALSQHQTANVVQIQSAARGASEGSVSLTQRQEVTIEQTQIITQRAASDTAATAARIDVDNDVTIVNYAKGATEDPEDDDDELSSLFASADDESIYLANPNDVAVTVTLTNEDGDVRTETLAAGESVTFEPAAGTYTLTAETSDGEDVEIAGRDELTLSVGTAVQTLTTTVDNQSLTVANPNDERVSVELRQDGDEVASFDVPANWNVTNRFAPGTYELTAETTDGESVPVDGEDAAQVTLQSAVIDLNASVEGGNLTVGNPSGTAVEVTVSPDDGDDQTFEVPAGERVTEPLEPGDYTLTGEAEDDRAVQIDGQSADEVTVEPQTAVDVSVTVAGENVSLANPSETDVRVVATDDDGENRTIEVPGGSNVTETLDPGNYTLTGESDADRDVLVENESKRTISVADDVEAPDATLAVSDQTGDGTEFVVANTSATVPFVLAVEYDGNTVTSETFDANESVDERPVELDPPLENDTAVTVTVRGAENDAALANETVSYEVTADEETETATETATPEAESPTPEETATPTEEPAPETPTPEDETEAPTEETAVPPDVENATATAEETETAATETATDTPSPTATETATPAPTDTATPTPTPTESPTPEPPEPGVEYVNCTAVWVNGTFNNLAVTVGAYDESGNATSAYRFNPSGAPWQQPGAPAPWDSPVDGATLVTVGETNETYVTDAGVRVVQIADRGAFDDEFGSFVAHAEATGSPAGDQPLSASNPDVEACRDSVRPESPTLGVESVEVQSNGSADVRLSYDNPNDAPMVPGQNLFTSGAVTDDPPARLEPGTDEFVVTWEPDSVDESVVWTANLSNFDLGNETATGPTADEVEGLLEPPTPTATPIPTDTPTPTATDTPTPADTPSDEAETPTEAEE